MVVRRVNSRNERDKSADVDSHFSSKRPWGLCISSVQSSPANSEADGAEKSVPASALEDEELTANSKVTTAQKLKYRSNIKVDKATLLDFTS